MKWLYIGGPQYHFRLELQERNSTYTCQSFSINLEIFLLKSIAFSRCHHFGHAGNLAGPWFISVHIEWTADLVNYAGPTKETEVGPRRPRPLPQGGGGPPGLGLREEGARWAELTEPIYVEHG